MLFDAAPGALYIERVVIVLGWSSVFFALVIIFSCRSFVSLFKTIFKRDLLKNRVYSSFYRFHSYYWLAFGVGIVAHLTMAISHTGLPVPGDPDAYVHAIILVLGLGGVISNASVFFSCRTCIRIASTFTPSNPLKNRLYRGFYQTHSILWWLFGVVASAHIASAVLHAGFWGKLVGG